MSRILLGVAVLIAVVAVAAYAWRTNRSSRSLQPIGLPEEEGWGDVALPVTAVDCTAPDSCRIDTLGTHDGRDMGIVIHVAGIDPNTAFLTNPRGGGLKATPDGIVLEPKGNPTLNLLRLLSSLYKQPTNQFNMPKRIKLTAITLEGDPTHVASSRCKIKVFFHDDVPDAPDYFEMYVNLDLPNGTVEFAEKDQEYRTPILRAFGARL